MKQANFLFYLLMGCSNPTSQNTSTSEIQPSEDNSLHSIEEGLFLHTEQGEVPYVHTLVEVPSYTILSAYVDDHSKVTFVHTGNYVYKIVDHNPKKGFLSKDTELENMLLCVSRDIIHHPYEEPFGEYSGWIMEHGFIAECGASYPEEDVPLVGVFSEEDYNLAVAIYRDILSGGVKFDIPNPLCQ